MYQERFEELKSSGKLPSPSGVGLRILVLTQSEDVAMKELVDTVQMDPALTGRLLRLASSALSGSSVPVADVHAASVRLGIKSVCHLALGFTLVSGNRAGKCRTFDYDRFWSRSLASAVASRRLAMEFSTSDASEAFTLGLMSDIGRLALASVHPEEYEDVQRMAAQDPERDLAEIEREHLYIDHRAVAAALLEDWGLPSHFSEAVLYANVLNQPESIADPKSEALLKALNTASILADVCITDPRKQIDQWPGAQVVCGNLGVEADEVCRVFDMIVQEWQEWGELMGIPTNPVLASPQLQGVQSAVGPAPNGDPSGGRLRVLAVDDDPVSLKLLVSLLHRSGHEVITASNGREALELYIEKGAQVVITDWMMPEMDGLMLCRQLRRTDEGRKLYILLLTGRTEEERIVEAFQAGVDDYIVKPFKPELLAARIQPAIRVIQLQDDYDRQVRAKERLNRQLDIEKRKYKMAAITDSLTDLGNRRYAMKRLEKEWANSQRSGTSFAVIMLDIDHFKKVNDRWGHDVGDAVLRATARTIQRVLRRGDTCARMGGEEFLVICPYTDTEEAVATVAERIRETVASTAIECEGFEGSVTISLGAAIYTPAIPSIDALLKVADEAVYEAKNAGRDQVRIGQPPSSGRASA